MQLRDLGVRRAGGMARLSGVVVRVTFTGNGGFFVAALRCEGSSVPVSVTGVSALPVREGLQVAGSGSFELGKYGRQFKFVEVEVSPPTTAAGIRRFLSSGEFAGVGTRTADKIVDAWGDQTLAILDHDPTRLSEIPGLSKKIVLRLATAWQAESKLRSIMVFALSQGITPGQIKRIIKLYGDQAAEFIKADPYRLIQDVPGFGFRRADEIARKLGVAFDSPFRIRACLFFILGKAASDGHCGYPAEKLIVEAVELVGAGFDTPADGAANPAVLDAVAMELSNELDAGRLVGTPDEVVFSVFLPHLFAAERDIAFHVRRLRQARPLRWISEADIKYEISNACAVSQLTLAEHQLDALQVALKSKLCVITGGPGVGKTTITKILIQVFEAKGWSFYLCAPTGAAADRMAVATGHAASTIHRLLGFKGGSFLHDEATPLLVDALVADEFSMPDVLLSLSLLRAIPDGARLVLVGDVDQLPSVGPGRVLADLIHSQAIPVVRLTQIFRQAAKSQIIQTAHAINAGRMPLLHTVPGTSDCLFLEAETPEAILSCITNLIEKDLALWAQASHEDIQMLTPMAVGPVGSNAFNTLARSLMNPDGEPVMHGFNQSDRVMQVVNDYDKGIFNGNIGQVEGALPLESTDDEARMVCRFGERRLVYTHDEADALRLSYSITIHKSQGSEFPVVIIPLTTHHFVMLKRNLIYTAITRGRRLVVMVGSKRALQMAIRNTDDTKRLTRLQFWLSAPEWMFAKDVRSEPLANAAQ